MDERTTSRENATSQQWEHPLDSLTELFFCSSKDIPNVAHHLRNVIKLNCALVVSFSRQLRFPRHIFWAAVSFFEMIFLVQLIHPGNDRHPPAIAITWRVHLTSFWPPSIIPSCWCACRWPPWITTWPSPVTSGTRRRSPIAAWLC